MILQAFLEDFRPSPEQQQCWADVSSLAALAMQVPCNQPAAGTHGLCLKHAQEIIGS